MTTTRNGVNIGLLILIIASILAYCHFWQIDFPNYEARATLHQQIIARSAPAPYNGRMLVPFIVEGLRTTLDHFMRYKYAFLLAYVIYNLTAIFFTIVSIAYLCTLWFTDNQTINAVLIMALTMPLTFFNHYFQPWSLLEPGLFAWLIFFIYHKSLWVLTLAILIIANRYTQLDTNRTPSEMAQINLQNWWKVIVNYILFFNITAYWAIKGIRKAPRFLQYTAMFIPIYLIAIALKARWYETRLLMTLWPIIIPLALFHFKAARKKGG